MDIIESGTLHEPGVETPRTRVLASVPRRCGIEPWGRREVFVAVLPGGRRQRDYHEQMWRNSCGGGRNHLVFP
jgi:hypothetical protein